MSSDLREVPTTSPVRPTSPVPKRPADRPNRVGYLTIVVVLGLLLAGWTGSTHGSTGGDALLAASGGVYGPGIGADSLANTQVGGSLCQCANRSTSYRFLATQSASLRSIRVYVIANGNSGYAHGTGGTMSITVQTDSGGSAHAPSGTILASTSYRPGNPGADFPTITFSSPAHLTAGRLYHLVFRNTDASPTQNFVSLDGLWTRSVTTPRQPGLSDLDWAQLMNDGQGWSTLRDYTPILDLTYSNGAHAGVGYMEVWVNVPKRVSGSSAVREYLVPKASHTVASVSVRVARVSGSSPLSVTLKTSGGSVLATGSISAGSISSSTRWATARLSTSVTLRKGTGYQLVLSTPSGSAYSAFGVERGNNYGFSSATYFTDGYAQYTTGSGWAGLTDESGRTATNADLQFVFQATGAAARASSAPRTVTRTPGPTTRPAPTVHPTPSPAASPSVAPSSFNPNVLDPIALVPTSTPSGPPAFRGLALSSAPDPSLGLLPGAFVAVVAVGLLAGLGLVVRRRTRP